MTVAHALIGCGRVAPNHVDGFRACALSEIVWACDRDSATLDAFAHEHQIARTTLDYREVLADPQVASVSITVDHAQHAALARAALEAGKHVLVEKPLALTVADGQALVDLARERGLILAVVSQHRYDPLIKQVRRMITRGDLGRLVSIWVTFQCRREPEYYTESYWHGTLAGEGGSVLINQAYHCLDLMTWLGGPVREATAMMDTLKLQEVIETEDTLVGLLRFESGALGSISITSASDIFWRTRIDVVGTQGSLCFDIDHPDTLHHFHVPPAAEQELREFLEWYAHQDEPPPGKGYYGISHRYQIDEFVRAVAGREQVTVDGREGLQTLDTLLKLYAAARQR